MATYKITNQEKFQKVVDVNLEGVKFYNNAFHGTVSIETEDEPDRSLTGEHGAHDYEEEYGFILQKY